MHVDLPIKIVLSAVPPEAEWLDDVQRQSEAQKEENARLADWYKIQLKVHFRVRCF